MPILIKDFTWTESDSHVYLNVPLKGANPKKMDVYVNDTYAKINFPPYFFELDLKEEVDSQAAVATIGNGCAKLEMPKREPGIWNEITYTPSSPSALRTRREAADAQFRQRADAAREAKASARRAEERRLVQNQIDVERADREAVANLKEEEKRRAEEDMARWVAETKTQRRGDAHQVATAARQTTRQAPVEPTQKITEIFDDDDDVTGLGGIDEPPDLEDMREEEEEEDNGESGIDMDAIRARVRAQLQPPTRDIPPPRGMNHEITIKFTSRGLKPTKTARESEDLKWESRIKSMQDEHARKMAPAAEGTSLEDVNPIFLKEKGNGFYRSGDYPAAVNAYTAALEADPHNLPCLSNRAACHLHLDSHALCIEDCTTALSILSAHESRIVAEMIADESVEDRRRSKVKLLVRRGTARVRLGDIDHGAKDYRQALELDPRNGDLRKDLEALGSRTEQIEA